MTELRPNEVATSIGWGTLRRKYLSPSSREANTAVHVSFSPEREQKFIYVINEDDEQVETLDRASGQILSSFDRAGHQTGEFTRNHNSAVDSKGNLYIGEVRAVAKLLKFKMVGSQ
jgi:hypothetical protein